MIPKLFLKTCEPSLINSSGKTANHLPNVLSLFNPRPVDQIRELQHLIHFHSPRGSTITTNPAPYFRVSTMAVTTHIRRTGEFKKTAMVPSA
jgi:hypothetical protein